MFQPAEYVYELNGEMKEMFVYYSNTGGIYNIDVKTDDLKTFHPQNEYVDENVISLFKAECSNILTKLNYIYMLDFYGLFNRLTNNQFL